MHDSGGAKRPTWRRAAVACVLAVVLVPLAVVNVRLYRAGSPRTTEAQLGYLRDALEAGAAERMQALFPEGYVFTWALYGLASAQVARQLPPDDEARPLHLAEARRAVDRVLSDRARSTFRADMEPAYGAFYTSWSLYTLAEYVRSAGVDAVPPELLATFRDECARLAAALTASPTPFLPSYPFLSWPADTAVGVAALGIYDRWVAPDFREVIADWIREASARLDPESGALTHDADADTGAPEGGVRGSSLALMSRVLVDADPDFARSQYELLRAHFVDQRLLAPGVREYPHGTEGAGDVDSGPLLLGYSGPALVVGAASARAHGDERLARTLLQVTEAAGLAVQLGGKRRYAGGLVPVGDAFIAWARSTAPPDAAAEPSSWDRLTWTWWQLPAHLLSSMLAALLLWRARAVWRSVAAEPERA